jgi:hypothetical protein
MRQVSITREMGAYVLEIEQPDGPVIFVVQIDGSDVETIRADDRFWQWYGDDPREAARLLDEVLAFHHTCKRG